MLIFSFYLFVHYSGLGYIAGSGVADIWGWQWAFRVRNKVIKTNCDPAQLNEALEGTIKIEKKEFHYNKHNY